MRLLKDKALAEDFRRGRQEALAEVYREYLPAVYALLNRGFGFRSEGRKLHFAGYRDLAELEDLVQEVFARAFAQRARLAYDGVRPYRNYLFTIARNLVVERQRSAAARRERLWGVSFADTMPTKAHEEPDRVLLARQLADHVEQFVACLEPQERSVFETRFRHGHSIETSAALLGVTQYRVKSAERRLRARLRHALRRHGHFPEAAFDRQPPAKREHVAQLPRPLRAASPATSPNQS